MRQAVKGAHKGRVITKKAAALMNSVALGMGASKVAVKVAKTDVVPKISVAKSTPKEAK